MQTKEFYLPLDVGYILGLSGPSQGTSRTDNVADVTLKNMLCGAIAEATNIWVTITELNTPSGSKYGVALKMDVKSLGKCQTESWMSGRVAQSTATIIVEIRNVNRGWITDAAAFPFPIGCDTTPFHFWNFRDVNAGGWLQEWASTTLRVDGAFTPCG
jgi:hypothetical protein